MKKFLALLVSVMLTLSCAAALAETTVLKPAPPDFPPFESMDDNGNVIGFDADWPRNLQGHRMDIVFEATSFDSIVTGVQTGLYDLGISGFYITESAR
jgi:ABC-type amino acid transport substrate-binding protein